jgi:hypothetical protein
MLSAVPMQRRLQTAAMVVVLGLLVEVLCLLGKGPIAFMLFAGCVSFSLSRGSCCSCICWLLLRLIHAKPTSLSP